MEDAELENVELDPSFSETMTEMHRVLGTRRMLQVLGWCVLAGATMKDDDGPADIRDRLMKMGFSRAAVYRFTHDMKNVVHAIEDRRGLTIPMAEVMREISTGNTSPNREFVVK